MARRDDGTDLVKVLDFGVAKLQALDEATAATGTGTILGTAAYMSPEQARGEKAVDKRTDVYALGAILFEILSQKMPHPGDSPNAILHHIATQPAVPLDSLRADLPAELVAIVGRVLSSDPAARPASAGALAQELAPFARREVWPAAPETSAPHVAALASTSIAAPENQGAQPPEEGQGLHIAQIAAAPQRPPRDAGPRRRRVVLGAGVLVAAAGIAVGIGGMERKARSVAPRSETRPASPLAETTRFFVPSADPATTQQIARLAAGHALEEASLLTAMAATPRALYFEGGTPEEVEAAVRKVVVRAAGAGEVPVLVVNNLPYRDCSQYSAGGVRDGAAYRAWLDGFVRGIGNDRAVVILEPDSLGIIPNNTSIDGSVDWCHPTVTNSDGKPVAAPGATADERYALLAGAIDRLAGGAPNALVYLDATHGGWLAVGEIAYRLSKAGVDRTRGFAVNVANYQTTAESVKYGTWISKCLLYAAHGGGAPARFKDCPSQYAAGAERREGLGVSREVVRRQRRSRAMGVVGRGAVRPFHRRHEPERPGDARRGGLRAPAFQSTAGGHPEAQGRRLVQRPERRRRRAPHGAHRRAARRCLPLDKDARSLRRILRHRGEHAGVGLRAVQPLEDLRGAAAALRSPLGNGRSARGRVVS